MHWIDLAQDRAFVRAVMNLRVHKIREISWLAGDLLAAHERLFSMGLVSYLVLGLLE